jgi:OPT family small oligopeptide transporter
LPTFADFSFTILLVLATQLSGFGIAGIARRFVVWPASMIWPYNLVTATTLNTFHAEDDQNTGGMTRFRFFLITMAGAFAWYFLPGFLFTCLSYFSYMCWIFPKNRVVNQLFGVSTGLGMGVINFDWAQITWIGSPLAAPWWAEVNVTIGFLLFYWIIVPILYYTNVWNFAYLPISVIQAADRFGQSYDIFQVLTPDADLNVTAYHEYSPVYLSATFAMTFMLAFALSTAILVHTALHYGPRIWKAIRNVKVEEDDIHLKLMRQYPEVPDWWFAVLLLFTFVLGIIGLEVWNTGFPIWGYILGIIVPFLYFVPAAFLYAITTQNVSDRATALISGIDQPSGSAHSGLPVPWKADPSDGE